MKNILERSLIPEDIKKKEEGVKPSSESPEGVEKKREKSVEKGSLYLENKKEELKEKLKELNSLWHSERLGGTVLFTGGFLEVAAVLAGGVLGGYIHSEAFGALAIPGELAMVIGWMIKRGATKPWAEEYEKAKKIKKELKEIKI